MSAALLLLVRGYRRWLSPMTGRHCRYLPTCSAYAEQAVQRHGPWRGGWLALRRVGRCHPFHPGGYDPVPDPPAAPDRVTMRSTTTPGTRSMT